MNTNKRKVLWLIRQRGDRIILERRDAITGEKVKEDKDITLLMEILQTENEINEIFEK